MPVPCQYQRRLVVTVEKMVNWQTAGDALFELGRGFVPATSSTTDERRHSTAQLRRHKSEEPLVAERRFRRLSEGWQLAPGSVFPRTLARLSGSNPRGRPPGWRGSIISATGIFRPRTQISSAACTAVCLSWVSCVAPFGLYFQSPQPSLLG